MLGLGRCDSCLKIRRGCRKQTNMGVERSMCLECREAANSVERMLGLVVISKDDPGSMVGKFKERYGRAELARIRWLARKGK